MSDLLPLAERLAPRRRPAGSPIGYHRWHDLLFVHWRLPPSVLRAAVPAGLDIDTWDGDAWLGVVAFTMTGVRPWWSPALPGLSAFHETNLRTYVHVGGRAPGVYFISLDAANSLAVRVARWRWNLPYYRARMTIHREGQRIRYSSRRLWPEPLGAETNLEAEVGDWLSNARNCHPDRSEGSPSRAEILRCAQNDKVGYDRPGTLEFFLAERYLLYTVSRTREVLCGQVHHTPYPLCSARLLHCEETLSRAAGIAGLNGEQPGAPCHSMFSPGVNVEIFPLQPAAQALVNLARSGSEAYARTLARRASEGGQRATSFAPLPRLRFGLVSEAIACAGRPTYGDCRR